MTRLQTSSTVRLNRRVSFLRPPTKALLFIAILLFARPASAEIEPAGPKAQEFDKGTWALTLYGGYNREFSSDPQVGYGAVGVGYYLFDGFSVTAEARTYGVSQDGTDATTYDLDFLLRHHIIRRENWSLFLDASAGVSQSTHAVPAGGTHFNFIEETGVGVTYKLNEHLHVITGARYWHLSNARLHGPDKNPGLNGVGGYIGLMWTF